MKRALSFLAVAGCLSATAFACSENDAADTVEADAGVRGVTSSASDAAGTTATADDAASATAKPDGSGAAGERDADTSSDGGADADADVDAATDAGNEADAAPPPPPPAVRYVVRFDTTDPAGATVGWPGARLVVRFTGTELRVTTSEVSSATGPSRYDVLVDGVQQPAPFAPANGVGTHVVAFGLPDGPHVVELHRRTESLVGVTQFRAFEYPNGGALLAPPPAPDRRIEFLGDSASNGYGIECAGPLMSFSGATENERKAFPWLATEALGADHHNIAFAGKGVLRNYDPGDDQVFGLLYPRTLPEAPGSLWPFDRFSPHVVWITLGGNDWDLGPNNRPPPDLAAFQAKYAELVALVRAKNPDAQIVCAIAPSLSDDYPVGYSAFSSMTTALTNVVAARNAAGDAKVHLFTFSRSRFPDDVTGCEYHSNAAFHAKLAGEVVTKVKQITGWP